MNMFKGGRITPRTGVREKNGKLPFQNKIKFDSIIKIYTGANANGTL